MSIAPKWHLTVADGERLVFHCEAEDWKEIQCLATEARAASAALRILYRRPGEDRAVSWD